MGNIWAGFKDLIHKYINNIIDELSILNKLIVIEKKGEKFYEEHILTKNKINRLVVKVREKDGLDPLNLSKQTKFLEYYDKFDKKSHSIQRKFIYPFGKILERINIRWFIYLERK
jgi:hypothetical protein